jgi:hypothetical protein
MEPGIMVLLLVSAILFGYFVRYQEEEDDGQKENQARFNRRVE